MSSNYKPWSNQIRRDTIFPAKVQSVHKEEKRIEVLGIDDILYPSVRLNATMTTPSEGEAKPLDRFTVYPRVGSWVLISRIQHDDNALYCMAYSDVEAVEAKIEYTALLVDQGGFRLQCGGEDPDSTLLVVDQGGFRLQRGGKDLYSTFKALFDQVQLLCQKTSEIVVAIGSTVDVEAVQGVKEKLDQLVKEDLNQILKPCP